MCRKVLIRAFCLSLLSFVSLLAIAQEQKQEKGGIMVIARPLKDSIMLRWAPESAIAWQVLNKAGYSIKRVTLSRDGQTLEEPEERILTTKPITPMPLAAWDNLVNKQNNEYAGIAAEALYSDDFEITQDMRGDIGSVIDKVQQNESRFSFALFSADQSFLVAKGMGLGFVDKSVKQNEKYLYEIYSTANSKLVKIDTGFVLTGYADHETLPKPIEIAAETSETSVMVSWNQEEIKGLYSTYFVERSEDYGKSFKKVNQRPVINTTADGLELSRRGAVIDSISPINKKLVYRVKGVTPFGETGPASDTIVVYTTNKLQVAAVITESKIVNDIVKLRWEIPSSKAEVLGFDVERSDNPEKGFLKQNSKRLPPNVFNFDDAKPISAGYYRIRAYGTQNVSTFSFPVFVQLDDSIPPAAPQKLKADVSKDGIVKLSWKANTEKDLFGYRVFMAHSRDNEFIQISEAPVTTNAFTDSLELKTLSKKVYYKILALDKRFNPSDFSEILEVKRPDIIPPVAPVFNAVQALTSGVYLAWYRSNSEDVKKHELWRAEEGTANWKLLSTFTDTITKSYTDKSALLKQPYSYKVRAIDESDLFSDSQPAFSKRLDLGIKPNITTFKGVPNREDQHIVLKWTYKENGVKNYLLYKAELNKPLRLYQTIDPKLNTFTDSELYINTNYQYRIKAVFADGSESGFSKEIIVNY